MVKSFVPLTRGPVEKRTYSRIKPDSKSENWDDICDRTVPAIATIGKLTPEETRLVDSAMRNYQSLFSGRFLWVGGTEWAQSPRNFYGLYNCSSTNVDSWAAFGYLVDMGMQGTGTGAVLTKDCISKLPRITNKLNVVVEGQPGDTPADKRNNMTQVSYLEGSSSVCIFVGDSREGWAKAYQTLLELSSDERFSGEIDVFVSVADVRPKGEPLKKFGGVANPEKLAGMFLRIARILGRAVGRSLNALECCLLIDEMASVIVAGNLRRTAGMRQFDSDDASATNAKMNLWMQDEKGNWTIDPERDALRMANHSRIFTRKPSLGECIKSVRDQHACGEGAIQWVGEAVARASIDILPSKAERHSLLNNFGDRREILRQAFIATYGKPPTERELDHRVSRFGLNPCVTADTWVLTDMGPRRVSDLVGKQHRTFINGKSLETTPEGFFPKGVKAVVKLVTKEGFSVRLTGNHQLLCISHGERVWREAKDLKPGNKVCIHNHRAVTSWGDEGETTRLTRKEKQSPHTVGVALAADIELLRKESSDHPRRSLEELWKSSVTVPELEEHLKKPPVVRGVGGMGYFFPFLNWDSLEKMPYSTYKQFFLGFFAKFLPDFQESKENVWQSIEFSHTHPIPDRQVAEVLQRMLQRMGILAEIKSASDGWYHLEFVDEIGLFAGEGLSPEERTKLDIDSKVEMRKRSALFHQNEFYVAEVATVTPDGEEEVFDCSVISPDPDEHCFSANGLVAHNCGEIIGRDFLCNLSEVFVSQFDATDFEGIDNAFRAASLSVASLLHQEFVDERFAYSREIDPIVAVCPTGLFDFFVQAIGVPWLKWWEAGRPAVWEGNVVQPQVERICDALGIEINTESPVNLGGLFKEIETRYFIRWRKVVGETVREYCDRHRLRCPNRYTSIQPSGTKSLLVGVSPGWHPPKAQRFIRRITFRRDHPVALACIDYGYKVIPGQSDKDENGALLNDPFDPRCKEWLVEIPMAVSWADLHGADAIAIEKFSALAQMDFYMNVQVNYVTHNTSGTLEVRESEIEELAARIYEAIQNNEGYISFAVLARFDDNQSFPRMPFEPITKEEYGQEVAEMEARRTCDSFDEAYDRHYRGPLAESGPVPCDSDKCLIG
jgi:ribonucleotide reductase, class II